MIVPPAGYDANGNQLSTPDAALLEYDADNRMTKWSKPSTGATEQYQYHPAGWRVCKATTSGSPAFSLYGPGGQMLYDGTSGSEHVYFAGRLLYTMTSSRTVVYHDRLGSVRYTDTDGTRNYYPFGEEIGSTTVSDQPKFAGTYRDATSGLDYAVNRYYSSTTGRFLTVDPLGAGAAKRANPGSWNQYTYVRGDPVNRVDPMGLDDESRPVLTCIIGATPFHGIMCEFVLQSYASAALAGSERVGRRDIDDPSPWKAFERYNDRYQEQLAETIATLSDNCRTAFGQAGISTAKLARDSLGIIFWDATRNREGSLFVGWLVPGSPNALQTLRETQFSPDGRRASAVTLVDSDGNPTRNVVLHGDFTNANRLRQNLTLLHEALHVSTGFRDRELAEKLGFEVGSPEEGSDRIREFLQNNCTRK